MKQNRYVLRPPMTGPCSASPVHSSFGRAASNRPNTAAGPGAAWFYATTSNLATQQWSTPQEITGSWGQKTACADGSLGDFNGNYPSFMSLNNKAGHLSTSGYVFYMNGCPGGPALGPRQFSTRAFTIATLPARLAEVGDLWAGLRRAPGIDLEAALERAQGRHG